MSLNLYGLIKSASKGGGPLGILAGQTLNRNVNVPLSTAIAAALVSGGLGYATSPADRSKFDKMVRAMGYGWLGGLGGLGVGTLIQK